MAHPRDTSIMTELSDKRSLAFAGLRFKGICTERLFPESGVLKFVVTVNADFIVTAARSSRFENLISSNFSTLDGQVVYWLAKLLAKPRGLRFQKISGSSFALDLLKFSSERHLRVFFLGALPKINVAAVSTARQRFGVDVAGFSPAFSSYPMSQRWNSDVLRRIEAYKPHILFVALGSPKQEFWIEDNREVLEESGLLLVMGCGGTLDFIAGAVPRAPSWIQKLGLEGVYRLAVQPSWLRLRRILRSFLVFPIVLRRECGASVSRLRHFLDD